MPIAGRERSCAGCAGTGGVRATVTVARSCCPGAPGIGKTRLAAELATSPTTTARRGRLPAGALAPMAITSRVLERPPTPPRVRPRTGLIIVDDLDAAATDALASLSGGLPEASPGDRGMLLVTHRQGGPPRLVAVAERLTPTSSADQWARSSSDARSDHRRAVRRPRRGRSCRSATCCVRSGGVPAAVHRVRASGRGQSPPTGSVPRPIGPRWPSRTLRDAEAALIGTWLTSSWPASATGCTRVDAADGGRRGGRDADRLPLQGPRRVRGCRRRLLLRSRAAGGRAHRPASSAAPFLGLVGDSGSGKSSASRAGLLPALAGGVLPGSDRWPQVLLRPGEHPLAELERALARALPDASAARRTTPGRLDAALATPGLRAAAGLVVDQFEEVFNATRDEAERSAFIDLLTGERAGLKVDRRAAGRSLRPLRRLPALARLLGSEPGARLGRCRRRELARGHRASRATGRAAGGAGADRGPGGRCGHGAGRPAAPLDVPASSCGGAREQAA